MRIASKPIRGSITKRIILSYILVLFSAFAVLGIVFSTLTHVYTVKQAKSQLQKDANAIFDIIAEEVSTSKDITNNKTRLAIRAKALKQFGNLESNFLLLTKDLKVLYPKNEDAEQFKKQVLPKLVQKLDIKARKAISFRATIEGIENLVVVMPTKNSAAIGLKGWIVLYNPIGPAKQLMKAMMFVLLISLAISALIAVIAGILIARSIAKPIILLKDRAEALSQLDFDGSVDIHTGDELEELGHTINRMAQEMKNHDLTQRRFFQNASHELKTPLMSIQGYAEGIKDGVFDSNDQALDIIVDESKRLKAIVEELIYLSKIESSEDSYQFSSVSINEVIENSTEKIKVLADKEGIRLNLMLYKDVIMKIDRDKITQALINIMGNCTRYASSEIKVVTANDGKWFTIRISDDGQGFENNELKNVFERFYKGKKGNSGLGLAITKAIIEKHHGTIEAANALQGGAEFVIRLPIVSR